MATQHGNILERWGITEGELTKLVDDNPSLRGMLFGYVAELRLGKMLSGMDGIADKGKADDHDRTEKRDGRGEEKEGNCDNFARDSRS